MVVVVLGEGGRLVRDSLSLLLPFSSVLLEELRASRFTRDCEKGIQKTRSFESVRYYFRVD
jgi:hypothetical protein